MRRQLAVGVEVVVDRADLHVAGGQDQVAVVHRADHIHHAELVRLQLQRIDVDHDLPIASAERLRHRCAGHVRDLVAHVVLAEIAQLRFVQSLRP